MLLFVRLHNKTHSKKLFNRLALVTNCIIQSVFYISNWNRLLW